MRFLSHGDISRLDARRRIPWRTPNPVFKFTAFLKSNLGKMARLKDKVTIAQEETIPNIWSGILFGDLD